MAKEGADVAILYLEEDRDAEATGDLVKREGVKFLALKGDVGDEAWCRQAVNTAVAELGSLDILVNNAAEQHPKSSLEEISAAQLEKTFRTNVFSMCHLTKAALAHMKEGSAIVNSTSVTAYRGSGGADRPIQRPRAPSWPSPGRWPPTSRSAGSGSTQWHRGRSGRR